MEESQTKSLRIAIVGCGNVATHLALGLDRAGVCPVGIYGRDPLTVARLAESLSAQSSLMCGALSDVASSAADVVIVSVADHAIADVAAAVGPLPAGTVVLHTSGTVGMELLSCVSADHGILYPLQTFSRDVPADLSEVPFFTEASTEAALAVADGLASMLSEHVTHADASRRRALHIAGVLSCNFPNYLLECAAKVLSDAGFGLDVVAPLVRATIAKAFGVGPHDAQTGPARRGDIDVIRSQAASLPDDMAEIYRALSRSIMYSHQLPCKDETL